MDIKKLQSIVVNALEDVKAQEIRVFDTIHLTSLFDRIAIASGTSNRQTKALAASVRDKVKESGGNIVSIEGEDAGEWVLVDLGDMIVHIMQPPIRAYYRLEEIWGDKEIKLSEAKRPSRRSAGADEKSASPKKTRRISGHLTVTREEDGSPAKKTAARKTAAKSAAGKKTAPSKAAKKSAAKKSSATSAAKSPAKTARKTASKTASKTAAKRTSRTSAKAKAG